MGLGLKFGAMAVLMAGVWTGTYSGVTWIWVSQNSGITNNLNSVDFVNANVGWAVGSSGVILKSTNGGNNWSSESSGTAQNLSSVQFTDTNNGWAVGNGGIILNTTNGGSTWVPQNSGITEPLVSVHFTDKNHGWAASSSEANVINTKNGGSTWNVQLPNSGSALGWESIYFADTNSGWVVGGDNCCGIIGRTTNGGMTWTAPDTASLPFYPNSVFFVNDSVGWSVGDPALNSGVRVMKTNNAANTWISQTSTNRSVLLASIHFTDTSNGWIVGDSGIILRTSNGGNTWFPQTSGTNVFLSSVSMVDTTIGWVVGSGGTILRYQEVIGDGIEPNFSRSNTFGIEISQTQLSFTLPNSFSNSSSTADIYTVSGNRLIERPIGSKSNSFSMPIGNLSGGKYFLEVKDAKDKVVEPFEISR